MKPGSDLLILSTWYPYPPDNGSRLRAFHLIRELAKRHRIRLVAGLQDDVAKRYGTELPDALGEFCLEVVAVPWQWYAPENGGGLRSLLSLTPRSIVETDNPALRAAVAAQLVKPTDAVLAMELGMAPFVPVVSPPVVLDQVEVSGLERSRQSAQGAARVRAGMTLWKACRYWRQALRRYAALTAVSEEEAEAVRGMLGTDKGVPPVVVIPNGVEVTAYQRAAGNAVPGRLLYNGALSYAPNREAVRWFAAEILPLVAQQAPEAHLVVTGKNDTLDIDDLRANPRIRLTGFLEDLRPILDTAALCVVPLRSGGGTRLKILEAFAACLPVVATTRGAAGLEARDGEHLVLADTPEAFASAVVRLLREPEGAEQIARRARRLAETRYDWTSIAAGLSDLLETVTMGKTRPV